MSLIIDKKVKIVPTTRIYYKEIIKSQTVTLVRYKRLCLNLSEREKELSELEFPNVLLSKLQ